LAHEARVAAARHSTLVNSACAAFTASSAARRSDSAAASAVSGQSREQERRPDLALIHLSRAESLAGREAAVAAAEARDELAALGMPADAARAQEMIDSLGGGRGPGGLSPREVEVLRLVARGRTNREIASALVISERTAVNHVSHIFDKLDVSNRAEASAWAIREGLA